MDLRAKRFEKQPSIKTIKRKMSRAWLGYVGADGIAKLSDQCDMTEDDGAILFCELDRYWFQELISPYIFGNTLYKNDLIGWHKDAKTYWMNLMGAHGGDSIVHFVSDDLKFVYVFHYHIQTTYMIGRINPDHELAGICLRKFKWASLH